MRRATRSRAFTLLEVMVAIAMLAVGLTAIFSSQGQAIAVASRARHVSVAANLARCKMFEVEEEMAREGFPAVDASGRDECCEGGEIDGFECEWSVERVVLPELGLEDGLLEDEAPEGDAPAGGPLAGSGAESILGDSAAQTNTIDSLLGGGGNFGGDAMAELAISLAFPVLKPSIEEQVRRAKVTVMWTEGERELSFDVFQYLVAEQGAAPDAAAVDQAIEQISAGGNAGNNNAGNNNAGNNNTGANGR
ncbi:MAG: type II secretion system protein [Myxococcota bacterium]